MALPIIIDDVHTEVVEAFTADDRARLADRLSQEQDGDTEAMVHAAWLMGANAVRAALQFHRTCRICGCRELEACPGGCAWVEVNLCSACDFADRSGQAARAAHSPSVSPLPPAPRRSDHRARPSTKWRAVPLYWRLAAIGAVAALLFQGGFALLNVPSTVAGMAGLVCLLASGFTALSAIRMLLKGPQ